MKIVAFSDAHPDKRTAGYPRFEDVRKAGLQVADYARSENADLLLFLGDLCEPDSPDYIRCLGFAMEVADRCGCWSGWLVGNHDVVEDGHGTTSLDPIRWMEKTTLLSEPEVWCFRQDLKVACFPYVAQDRHYDPTDGLSEMHDAHDHVDLVVSHLMLDGIGPGSEADMRRGRDVFLPVEAIQKAWPRAKILNGHYHRRQTFKGVEVIGSLANLTRAEVGVEPVFLEINI